MRITLLNGPPRCGKDTLGGMLEEQLLGTGVQLKFAKALKEKVHASLGLLDHNGRPLPHDAFEPRKDEPLIEFHGVSPRQAYIEFSEGYAKPLWGPGIFGEWLVEEIVKLNVSRISHVIVTDSGFRSEATVLIDRFGADNVRLVQIRRDGCSFDGDSRSYIHLADLGVKTYSILNHGTLEDLRACASNLSRFSPEGSPSVF